MRRGIAIVGVLGFCLAISGAGRSDDPKPGAKDTPKDEIKLPTKKQLMAGKLKESQLVLEGLALNDLDKVSTAADELIRITRANDFLNAYKGDEYLFHLKTFRKAAEAVAKKARDKNLDGVMVAYSDLTLSCVKCHQAMRDKQFDAKLPTKGDGEKLGE